MNTPIHLDQVRVSTVANSDSRQCVDAPALALLRAIKGPTWATRIERVRRRTALSGKAAGSLVKKKLPAASWSGTFDGLRGNNHLARHSGLVGIDLDNVGSPAHIRAACAQDPHCAFAFLSPGGHGIKAAFACDPNRPHALSWLAVRAHVVAEYGPEVVSALDPIAKDVARLCFVSHDPEAYIATGPIQPVSYEGIALPAPVQYPVTTGNDGGLLSPGDDYNQRGDVPALLVKHGWTDLGDGKWHKPGKTTGAPSASLGCVPGNDRMFHLFTDNAPGFDPEKPDLMPFALYTILEYGGNFSQAAAELRRQGFGEEPTEQEYAALFGEPDEAPASDDHDEPATPAQYDRLFGTTEEVEPSIEVEPVVEIAERDLGTDLDASLRFATACADKLRYVPGIGWHFWDGRRWAEDHAGRTLELAKGCARDWTIRSTATNGDGRDKLIRGALTLEGASHIKAAVELAKTSPRFVLPASALDRDPWILNAENGTLDLRTGTLRAHRRDDMISKRAPVRYVLGATHPMLDRFLAGLEARSPGMSAFLARCFGACLTGDSSPETLFLLQGAGGSGKTTLTEAVAAMLGDYTAKLAFESFCLSKNGRSPGGASPDLMKLRGARLAYASEGDQSARLDAGVVKTVTGGEPITARGLYADPITFGQTWKLWLVSNYDPRADSDDSGLWRRMLKLVFKEIPADERDPGVKRVLTEDPAARSALLAWALAGCIDWQARGGGRIGLAPLDECMVATEAYRQRQDPLAQWWGDLLCDAVFVLSGFTTSAALWTNYTVWCAENGVTYPVSNRRFSTYLEAKGLVKRATSTARGWEGIHLPDNQ